jgi:glycosyltransferase involved in cell wall biosynthesis
MKILIVSQFEYSVTNRGIDVMTTFLVNKKHAVEHMMFYTRTRKPDRNILPNLKQLYFYDHIQIYRHKFRHFLPGFLINLYFKKMIQKEDRFDWNKYEMIILEGGYPVYLSFVLKNPIVYRQSDPIKTPLANRGYFKKLELQLINKSIITSSALEKDFFFHQMFSKYFYWHSGYVIPNIAVDIHRKKTFVYMGLAPIDYLLIKKIAKRYPNYKYLIIGPFKDKLHLENIIFYGYLNIKQYCEIISSASIFIIPMTRSWSNKVSEYSYTGKMLLAMHYGIPILVRRYGTIQIDDEKKKLYVYDTNKQALEKIESIVSKIETGEILFNVETSTRNFLDDRSELKNTEKLDVFFENVFKLLEIK